LNLLITGYIFSNYSLLAYKEISTMKFDLYSTRKKTSLGTQMVEKVNRLIAGQINGLFDDSPSCKFLEIGPGVGLFADILHSIMRDKLKYHAIEPNASLCERGIQKGYAMENAQIPPFPDLKKWGSFDCIYFSHVLEHMPGYTAVAEALNGVQALLKDGGYLVIFSPDYLDWKDDFFNGDYSHSYITTERRFRELLPDAGFELLSTRRYRACYSFPATLLIYPVHITIKLIAGFFYSFFPSFEKLFKMKITFSRNFLLVCRKKSDVTTESESCTP
jgi:ubiquinone/menaquinone biosynthesis C-methylase UbiE